MGSIGNPACALCPVPAFDLVAASFSWGPLAWPLLPSFAVILLALSDFAKGECSEARPPQAGTALAVVVVFVGARHAVPAGSRTDTEIPRGSCGDAAAKPAPSLRASSERQIFRYAELAAPGPFPSTAIIR
jgi:hypothetical protein